MSALKSSAVGSRNFDESSKKGQFGWMTHEEKHIPYIFREEKKFCSLHVLAMLWPQILDSKDVVQYMMSSSEAKLYNEINKWHCDGALITGFVFTPTAVVVPLEETLMLLDADRSRMAGHEASRRRSKSRKRSPSKPRTRARTRRWLRRPIENCHLFSALFSLN